MEKESADYLIRRINECPFNRHNGIRALSVTEGEALVEAQISETSNNIWHVPHGGLLFALGDVSSGLAAHSLSPDKVMTINGDMQFLAAAPGAAFLRARGTVVKAGHSTLFIRVEIHDDSGLLIAAGQYTMHRIHERRNA